MRTSVDSKSDGPWVLGVVGGVFASVGVVCAVVAVWTAIATHGFLGRAHEIDGVVVDHAVGTDCSGTHHSCSTSIRPVVAYAVDGLTYKFADPVSDNGNGHPEGSHVTVLYDPDDPSRARLRHGWFGTYLATWICGLLATVFGGLGLVLLVLWLRTRGRRPEPVVGVVREP